MKFALNKLKKDFDELWKIEKFRSAVEKLKEKVRYYFIRNQLLFGFFKKNK